MLAVLFALGMLVVPLPSVSAQAAPGTVHLNATLLSEPASTSAGCTTVKHYGISLDLAEVPDGKAYWDEISGGLGCAIWFDLVLPTPVELSGKGLLAFTYACDAFTSPGPNSDFRVRLYKNGEQVSQVDVNFADTCTSAGGLAEIDVDTADTAFDAGDTLSLGVVSWFVNTPSSAVKNLHMKVGPSAPATFTAAGLGALFGGDAPTPRTILENLTGPEIVILHSFANGTDVGYEFSWASNLTDLRLAANATVLSGNATFRVVDGANQTAANDTFDANVTRMLNVTGVVGNWTIVVAYQNFTGSFELTLGALAKAEPITTASNATLAASNATLAPAGKESPALHVVSLLFVVAAVAIGFRRRQT